jgi:hypothetical protein
MWLLGKPQIFLRLYNPFAATKIRGFPGFRPIKFFV